MATNADTQAYLTEAKSPTVLTPATAQGATKTYAGLVGDLNREMGLLAKLLQAAEIAEADVGLRGQFAEGFQKLGALDRASTELQRIMREVIGTYRDFADWEARMRSVAGPLGYTV